MEPVSGIFSAEARSVLKAKFKKAKLYMIAFHNHINHGRYNDRSMRWKERNSGEWFGEVLNEQQNVEMTCKNIVSAVRKGKTSYLKGLNRTLNKDLALKTYGML